MRSCCPFGQLMRVLLIAVGLKRSIGARTEIADDGSYSSGRVDAYNNKSANSCVPRYAACRAPAIISAYSTPRDSEHLTGRKAALSACCCNTSTG